MATAEQIREKAIKKLGINGSSQTTSSSLQNDIDAAYAEVYAQLDTLGLATWDSDEEVPSEFVNPVKNLVAFQRVDEYSVPAERYSRIVRDAKGVTGDTKFPGAVAEIREMQASNAYKTPEAEYF